MSTSRLIKALSLVLLASLSYFSAEAQRRDYNNISYFSIYYSPYVGDFYYTGGISFGTLYDGDLGGFMDSKIEQPIFKPSWNIGVGYQITHWVSARFDIHRYKFEAREDYVTLTNDEGAQRYLGFTSSGRWDISINLIHDLTAKGTIDLGQKKYSPYLITGIGLTQQGGTLEGLSGVDSARFPEATREESVAGWGVNVPLGVGFKYYIKHNMHLAFEARGAFSLSDKLDHVGPERGNPSYKDFYMIYGLKFTWQKSYRFNYDYYRKKHYKLRKKRSKKNKSKSDSSSPSKKSDEVEE